MACHPQTVNWASAPLIPTLFVENPEIWQKELTIVNRVRKILFYGGLEPQDYKDCQPEISAENHSKLHVYLTMAAGLLFAATCLSGGMNVLREKSLFYGAAFLVFAGLRLVDMMFPDVNGLFLRWQMYAFAAVLYVLGIAVAARCPEELSVSFIAFMLAVPMLFVMPPIQHITNILFFDAIFIVLVARFETGRAMTIDIVDSVVFGLVSCIISSFMMLSMHQNFLSRMKLRKFANYDILTGMQNRNAYESNRKLWAQKCSVCLSCVYVDANGLHELNNSSGHEKGDQMLQTVALEMREFFGKNNCYRTGGDEFVAFVLDSQYAAVRAQTEELAHTLERKGYSVAIGVANQSAGGIDVDELIKLAEKRMYSAKEEHYRAQQQTLR